jgi:hypothetical protein
MLLIFTHNTGQCYGYEDYVVLQVLLCYVITLINNLIHDFMQRDNMMIWELAQNKKEKKLWISPKAMEKDYI